MDEADLSLVEGWLRQPHVARWYLQGSTLEAELEECRESIRGRQPTHLYVAEEGGRPIGWCQWYRCDDYPDHAAALRTSVGAVGIDYAIGEQDEIGIGRGTELIGALVAFVRDVDPRAAFVADPDATNLASRRVLEKNGFELLGERPLASEPVGVPMAVYRLPAPSVPVSLRNRSRPGEPAGRDSS
jgi:aminoglycoside 6'-N-acetyltransferase